MKMTALGFAHLRAKFNGLRQDQVDSINYLVEEIDADKSITYPQAAYILATIWWETDRTLQPIEEYGKGRGRTYGTWYTNSKGQKFAYKNYKKNSVYLYEDYPHLYYGRGETQNTWFDNYEKLSKVFNVDFLRQPELLLTREWSTKVTIYAMKAGLYTGHKLTTHISQSKKDYYNARRIINGTDKAQKIADLAEIFEYALRRP